MSHVTLSALQSLTNVLCPAGLSLHITIGAAVIIGCLLISLALLATHHRNRMHLYKKLSKTTSNQGKVTNQTDPTMVFKHGQPNPQNDGRLAESGPSWKAPMVHSESPHLKQPLQTPVGVSESGPLEAGAWSGGSTHQTMAVEMSEGSGSRLLTHQGVMSDGGMPASGSNASTVAATSFDGRIR